MIHPPQARPAADPPQARPLPGPPEARPAADLAAAPPQAGHFQGSPPVSTPTARPRLREAAAEPAFGLWPRDAWLNDALRAAVEHARRSWPVQFLLTDMAEWRPDGVRALLADGGPLRVSAMGRGSTETHPSGRTFGAGVGRAGSLTPAQRHRANGAGS